MLNTENTVLILIDVQGKLANLMRKKSMLFDNLQRLIKGMQILGIPIIWVEHCPEGLGPTIPEVADLLSDIKPISKHSFSCCGRENFKIGLEKIKDLGAALTSTETALFELLKEATGERFREILKIVK